MKRIFGTKKEKVSGSSFYTATGASQKLLTHDLGVGVLAINYQNVLLSAGATTHHRGCKLKANHQRRHVSDYQLKARMRYCNYAEETLSAAIAVEK